MKNTAITNVICRNAYGCAEGLERLPPVVVSVPTCGRNAYGCAEGLESGLPRAPFSWVAAVAMPMVVQKGWKAATMAVFGQHLTGRNAYGCAEGLESVSHKKREGAGQGRNAYGCAEGLESTFLIAGDYVFELSQCLWLCRRVGKQVGFASVGQPSPVAMPMVVQKGWKEFQRLNPKHQWSCRNAYGCAEGLESGFGLRWV